MASNRTYSAADFSEARRRLVRRLTEERIIRSRSVASAFLCVPREAFVPADSPAAVYADTTIPVEGAQGAWLTTSSQPTMMAIMLEQLNAAEGDHVLEIGTGTGYNAALLDRIVGGRGSVDSVEIEEEAAANAERSLDATESRAAVHHGDGADGWPNAAPYQRIIATVAVWDIPPAWESQAADEAVVVAPITVLGSDYSVALNRDGARWVSRSIEPCAFVRFKGRLAQAVDRLAFGDQEAPALVLSSEPGELPAEGDVRGWLESGTGEALHGFGGRLAWDGFAFWLLHCLGARHAVRAMSSGRGLGWQGPAVGIWDEDGMAMVACTGRLESFGTGNAPDAMRSIVAGWRAAGAPPADHFRIEIGPLKDVAGPALRRWVHGIEIYPA